MIKGFQKDDIILMTTDGLTNLVSKEHLYETIKKENLEQIPKLRKNVIIAMIIAAIVIGIATKNIWAFSISVIIYTCLYCIVEKFIKTEYDTKEQIKININNINMSIEKDYEKLKEYEKELTEIIERTNYQEKDIEKEQTWDDLFYTEEEIRLYMQESPAPFKPETIFGNNEDIEEQTDSLQQSSNGHSLVRKRTFEKNNK